LEDTVAGVAGPAGEPPPSPPQGAPPAWPALAARLVGDSTGSTTPIWLRTPLADLTTRWTARLNDRVPFQYTVGAAHWRDLVLAVGPGVLCPRPETEQLVDLAVGAVKAAGDAAINNHTGGGPWADVCTGSGAVAAGLMSAFRGAGLRVPETVWATDVCPAAASWARANVARLGLQGTVRVVEGDLLAALPPGTPPLRGLLSNPPYIPQAQMPGLQPEVGLHEPSLALDGGDAAGLVILRRLCTAAATALAPGGFLGLETAGHGQAELVAALLIGGNDFEGVAVHEDMCGVVRFVTGRRR
jgi:release factor glutamine methyltransferase